MEWLKAHVNYYQTQNVELVSLSLHKMRVSSCTQNSSVNKGWILQGQLFLVDSCWSQCHSRAGVYNLRKVFNYLSRVST